MIFHKYHVLYAIEHIGLIKKKLRNLKNTKKKE